MGVPIRSRAINTPGCPQDTDLCRHYSDCFEITVEKRSSDVARPVYIHTWGLGCEELVIERVYAENCDPLYSPLFCNGKPRSLGCNYPDTVLTMPGRYRFSTASGNALNWGELEDCFGYEWCPVHVDYAQLWLQQQALCCACDGGCP